MKLLSEEKALELTELLLKNDKEIKNELEQKIPNVNEFATKEYVNESVANIDVDLSGYATETFVTDKISEIEIPSLDGYATNICFCAAPTTPNDSNCCLTISAFNAFFEIKDPSSAVVKPNVEAISAIFSEVINPD